ncbi:[Fe-Fe] hydrogenase large subunit C-terminal domain-containing protein [Lachnospiraceae bacterium 62-35]
MGIIDFKGAKCKHCYKCVRHCDVKAVMIKDGRAEIMEDKCVLCGHCLQICPQSAKTLTSDLQMVKNLIRQGEKVIISMAPSYMGLLPCEKPGQINAALKKLGFAEVRETSEGAAAVTAEYVCLLQQGEMENIITTCCPSVNSLIEIYYPQLIPYMAPVVSPMVAHGKMIKKEEPNAKVVFLGPCIAKKQEAIDSRHEGVIDGVLNFNDVRKWLDEEDIVIKDCEDVPFRKIDPKVNRIYPITGGVINSVIATEKGQDHYRKLYVHGSENCMELCRSLERKEIKGCFIEMNMCEGGCIKGPAVNREEISPFRIQIDMEEAVDKVPAEQDGLKALTDGISFHEEFMSRASTEVQPTEAQIQEILRMTGKNRPEDELNCGACGYATCREKAVAVFQKKAELNMCIPFMNDKAESFANLVMETSPNIVLIVDRDMKVLEYSAVGEKYFGKTRQEALEMYLFEFVDPSDFQWVFDSHQNIHGKKVSYPEYNMSTLQNIVYIPKQDVVLATFIDITKEEEAAQEDYEKKLETIDLAQKVIHKQMMVAQEIAGLLGETTAETKTTLTKLCKSLLDEGSESGGR